ncbi:hypothetical protein [Streptomyces lonarensis]|uniref:ABC transporter n=1 Tax=Streptomyces lonarensis TaxID=700599 RepID=A0A7X6CYF9_9ACTN|nr:hypothetical protein [Streptomyces lonarensis]NJQ04718.1 hypothetical protein [Streptomyces lonarensis]
MTARIVLHLRSRRVPSSAAALAAVACALWPVGLLVDGPADPRLVALAVAGGVTAGSVGLAGQDPDLDRTAALRWAPRRAVHLLAVGATVAAVLLLVGAVGVQLGTVEVLLRTCAGAAGLVGLGAALWGARQAWLLPLGWFAVVVFAPVRDGFPDWVLAPPGSTAASWTAAVLLTAGTATYAVFGPRR